jgi:tetratricopeptide (TPR) repeat protein
MLVKNRDKVVAVTSEEAVNTRIESACKKTLNKAIEFKNETLLAETKAKMKSATTSDRATAFAMEADMNYYKAVKDVPKFLKAAKTYQKTTVKNNAAKLHDLTVSLIRAFPEDKKVLAQASEWAEKAAQTGGLAEYWMTLAGVYKLQGDKKKAKTTAEKAKAALGEADAALKSKIEYFIQSLEG